MNRSEYIFDRFLSQVQYMLDRTDFTESEMETLKTMHDAGFDSTEAAEYMEEMSQK